MTKIRRIYLASETKTKVYWAKEAKVRNELNGIWSDTVPLQQRYKGRRLIMTNTWMRGWNSTEDSWI